MPFITIPNLPPAISLSGTEPLEIVQGGTSVRTTTQAIANLNTTAGTVTSVALSPGSTGLTVTGSPITTTGTFTLGGVLSTANGGTGTTSPNLTAGTNITITGTWPNQTITAGQGAAYAPILLSTLWTSVPSISRLAISGTGTVTIDTKDLAGNITLAVLTYSVTGATFQVNFPFYGTSAASIRATYTGTASAEVF